MADHYCDCGNHIHKDSASDLCEECRTIGNEVEDSFEECCDYLWYEREDMWDHYFPEDMDGDFDSAMGSAGHGMDEDYDIWQNDGDY